MHNKLKYAKIYKTKICAYIHTYYMHKYAKIHTNMQNQICILLHNYAFSKTA